MESFQSYSRGTGKGHTAYCCPVSGVEYGDFNNITTTWVRTLNLTLYLTQCCLSVQNNNTDSRQAGHSHLSPVTAAHQLSTSYDIFELRIQPGSALGAGKKKKRPTGCWVVTHAGCHGAVQCFSYKPLREACFHGQNPARRRPYSAHSPAGNANVPAAEMWQPSCPCHVWLPCLQRA